MAIYSFKKGNGNDGEHHWFYVEINDDQNPFVALEALVISDYIVGGKTRKYISKEIHSDGDSDSVYATISEGPNGETEYGAAWLTASLEKVDEYEGFVYQLFEVLDRGAKMIYKKRTNLI